MIDIPVFDSKEDTFDFLIKNEKRIIAAKKAVVKEAQGVSFNYASKMVDHTTKEEISIGANSLEEDKDIIEVTAIINTTNIMDSHDDVHVKGIWNRSLKSKKTHYLVQEHKFDFAHTISDNMKAGVRNLKFSDFGIDSDLSTQALVFKGDIEKEENPLMFGKYKRGKVKQHSVGMIYKDIKLALNTNDPDMEVYKQRFDKYIDTILNKEEAIEQGYFYIVREAEIVEGSAVIKGSNPVTPTADVKSSIESNDLSLDNITDGNKDDLLGNTATKETGFDYELLLNNINQ